MMRILIRDPTYGWRLKEKKCLNSRKQSLIQNQSAARWLRSDWQQKPPHTTSTYYSLPPLPLSSRHICCNLHHGINLQQHRSLTILKVWCSWSFIFKRELMFRKYVKSTSNSLPCSIDRLQCFCHNLHHGISLSFPERRKSPCEVIS